MEETKFEKLPESHWWPIRVVPESLPFTENERPTGRWNWRGEEGSMGHKDGFFSLTVKRSLGTRVCRGTELVRPKETDSMRRVNKRYLSYECVGVSRLQSVWGLLRQWLTEVKEPHPTGRHKGLRVPRTRGGRERCYVILTRNRKQREWPNTS